MKRRQGIRLLAGGLAYLMIANSCKKDLSEEKDDNAFSFGQKRNFKNIFEDAIAQYDIKKFSYLVEKKIKNAPLKNEFLKDRFLSDVCDEVHVYGYIKKTNGLQRTKHNKEIDTQIFRYKDQNYEVCLYSETKILRLPCDQKAVRKVKCKHDLLSNSSSEIKVLNFDKRN
ncbi:hypothetical protein [Sphingobacterium sp. GVS05A]|uniref:hypothetical protein n=1 Tax=Sphingobacterium sp. GVS05A TaxID=2862679 RepID=UPI001CBBA5A5|nr:hypothetical protein [Sphingobacterium sp. GVS05A]